MAESPSTSNSPAPIAEIDLGPSKLDQFLEDHSKKLIIGAILIALGVIGYVIYDGLADAKAQEAGSALLEAEKVGEYQDVIKKWPESNAAASALTLLADLQWADSQPDSIAALEDFIGKYPEHPALGTAKVSLGLRLLEQGKTSEATDILNEVADSDKYTYIAPLAFIALGDIAKAEGKIEDAKKRYQQAQDDPTGQGNTYAGMAADRLSLANAKPPVKIKPALPEPPQPNTPPTPPAPGAATPPTPPTPDVPAPLLEKPDTPETTPKEPAPDEPAPPAPATPPGEAAPEPT